MTTKKEIELPDDVRARLIAAGRRTEMRRGQRLAATTLRSAPRRDCDVPTSRSRRHAIEAWSVRPRSRAVH